MYGLLNSPAALLVIVGALLGANFPLGKLVAGAGVPGLVWAALLSLSATISLGAYIVVRRRKVSVNAQHMRYFLVTAITAYAVPNTLVFAAIPHLGSGLTSIFYALSPIVTLAFSVLAGLRKPRLLEMAGISVGLIGALLVVSGRGEIGKPADMIWIAAGVMVPVSLSLGNVYRTLDWPKNADPIWLAVGSHAIAALVLALLSIIFFEPIEIFRAATVPSALAMQTLASTLMLPLFFRLQHVGGPVTLSQIGIVAAAVGVGIGALVLGERYAFIVWAGVAIIAVGVGLTVLSRIREARSAS